MLRMQNFCHTCPWISVYRFRRSVGVEVRGVDVDIYWYYGSQWSRVGRRQRRRLGWQRCCANHTLSPPPVTGRHQHQMPPPQRLLGVLVDSIGSQSSAPEPEALDLTPLQVRAHSTTQSDEPPPSSPFPEGSRATASCRTSGCLGHQHSSSWV